MIKQETDLISVAVDNFWRPSKLLLAIAMISVINILFEPNLVYADDCFKKWWDAEDCMRTGGFGQAWAALLVVFANLGMRGIVNVDAARMGKLRTPSGFAEAMREVGKVTDRISGTNRTNRDENSDHGLHQYARDAAFWFKVGVSVLAGVAGAFTAGLPAAAVSAVIGFFFPDMIGIMTDMVLGPAPDQTSGRRRAKPKNRTVNISVGAIIGGGVMALGFIPTLPFIIPGMVVGGFAGAYYNRLP